MKWKWLAAFLFGLFVVAIAIYRILDPEVNELNEAGCVADLGNRGDRGHQTNDQRHTILCPPADV
jgi:hypothetical protein